MKIFYVRVSSLEQNEARQLEAAKSVGADMVFIDKASGKNLERAEFKKMMTFVRKGDCVYVCDISRIARNTKDLLNVIEVFKEKNVEFVSLKEKIDTNTSTGKFILTVFGAIAELERDNIKSRQAEGIKIAKANHVYKGRKPKQVDKPRFDASIQSWKQGNRTAVSIMREFGISSTTFYKWVNTK